MLYIRYVLNGQTYTGETDLTQTTIEARILGISGIEFSDTPFPPVPPPPVTAASLATAFGIVAGSITLTAAKAKVMAELNRLTGEALAGTDWYVSRMMEVDTAMPATVVTYRGSVRSFNRAKSDAITAAVTLDAVIALFQPTAKGTPAVFNVPQ
jgi:hypothetical protein